MRGPHGLDAIYISLHIFGFAVFVLEILAAADDLAGSSHTGSAFTRRPVRLIFSDARGGVRARHRRGANDTCGRDKGSEGAG